MLYSIDGVKMTSIPVSRQADFAAWMQNLAPADYQRAQDAINAHANSCDVFVSSHVPGNNWIGTVYEPLYFACRQNQTHAGFFFGLIVWQTMIDREAEWYFKPGDKDGDDVLGTTYFRKR